MVHEAQEGDEFFCSRCKSAHVDVYDLEGKRFIACFDCGFEEELDT